MTGPSPAEVIRDELKRLADQAHRRREAIIFTVGTDDIEDDSIERAMLLPNLEELAAAAYDRFDEVTDSWEEVDDLRGREDAFNEAAQVAQDVIDYGIHAFDPNHARFKTARWIVSHEDGREHDPAFFTHEEAQAVAARLGEGWAVMDAGEED